MKSLFICLLVNRQFGRTEADTVWSSCLTYRRCSTCVFSVVVVVVLFHLQHFFVSLLRYFCLSGICVSVNQTLQSYVPAVCNIVFTSCFSFLLCCGKELSVSERNNQPEFCCHRAPSWYLWPADLVMLHIGLWWWFMIQEYLRSYRWDYVVIEVGLKGFFNALVSNM